jgi:IS5 family transposase
MTALPPDDEFYTESDAKNILKRATELERDGVISASRLREIAQEAQISPEAMNRALKEAVEEKRLTEQKQEMMPEPESRFARSHLSLEGWVLVASVVVFTVLMLLL